MTPLSENRVRELLAIHAFALGVPTAAGYGVWSAQLVHRAPQRIEREAAA